MDDSERLCSSAEYVAVDAFVRSLETLDAKLAVYKTVRANHDVAQTSGECRPESVPLYDLLRHYAER
jgi:hypothetical protein